MPPDLRAINGVDDSKQLDAETRERLAIRIKQTALAVGIGAASAREVDRINIYHATVLAMRRALARVTQTLGARPDHVLVDGLMLRTLGTTHTAIVKGDAKCYAIACASIVAKVTRDRLMHSLHVRYDGYGWITNSGYGTAEHRSGISAHGLTPHHRVSFCTRLQTEFDFEGEGDSEIEAENDVSFDSEFDGSGPNTSAEENQNGS